MSRSGETCRPSTSRSSPTLPTIVRRPDRRRRRARARTARRRRRPRGRRPSRRSSSTWKRRETRPASAGRAARCSRCEIVERVHVVDEVRGVDRDATRGRGSRRAREIGGAVAAVERLEQPPVREAKRIRRAVERLDEREPARRRRGERARAGRRATTHGTSALTIEASAPGVDAASSAAATAAPWPPPGSATSVGARLAGSSSASSSAVTTRGSPTAIRGGEHVAEHRERERPPDSPRGGRSRVLPSMPAKRNDDRRHREDTSRRGATPTIAQTLEAATRALLDLAGASHYSVARLPAGGGADPRDAGAGRRARARGPRPRAARDRAGIERRLIELVETGRLAELDELEREVEPAARRARPPRRARPAADGRARPRARHPHRRRAARGRRGRAAARGARGSARRPSARSSRVSRTSGRAAARPADQPRARASRRRSRASSTPRSQARCAAGATSCTSSPSSRAAPDAAGAARRRRRPLVAIVEREREHRAVGVTVEGDPGRARRRSSRASFGTELVRATGSRDVRRLARRRCRSAATEAELYARARPAVVPARAARGAARRATPAARRARADPRRPALPHDVVGREGVGRGDGASRRATSATSTSRSATTRRTCASCRASTPMRFARQAEEIAAVERAARAVSRAARHGVRHPPRRRRSTCPTTSLAELDWVQLSLHAGQREDAEPADAEGRRGDAPSRRCAASATRRAGSSTTGRRTRCELERCSRSRSRRASRSRRTACPTGSTCATRRCGCASRPACRIVCSTDAHSVRGLGNMQLSVATARRGWATAADVLNTRGLDEVLGLRPVTGSCSRRGRLPGPAWDELGDVDDRPIDEHARRRRS